jgi:hypothetical protein
MLINWISKKKKIFSKEVVIKKERVNFIEIIKKIYNGQILTLNYQYKN